MHSLCDHCVTNSTVTPGYKHNRGFVKPYWPAVQFLFTVDFKGQFLNQLFFLESEEPLSQHHWLLRTVKS